MNPIDDLRLRVRLPEDDRMRVRCRAAPRFDFGKSSDWGARMVAAYDRLAAMGKVMDQGDRSKVDLWKRHDWDFHQALILACGSDVLMDPHGGISDKYLRYQIIALSFRGSVAAAEHHALLDAAVVRDAGAASGILHRHLLGGVEHALASGTI